MATFRAGRLAWLLCGGAHAGVLVQDPEPLTTYYDRTLKDYKGLTWDTIKPENAAKMLRVRDLQDKEFRELVRKGYPFIVEDCVRESEELRDFSCAEFGRRWPKEHMRAEYTPGQHHIYLKDPTWYSEQRPTAKAEKHLSRGKPLSGPYIWHVKDETEDRQTKRSLMEIFPVPYFLNISALNANEAKDSFEFWFVLENGGSQAHADAYCETTISMQLRGSKKWRLGAFPNISNAFQPWSFHDADIYRAEKFWRPEHEEMVGPGMCVVFPMGYIHETYVGEGDGGEDGCSVASTFQFQDPQPVHQWKNFLTRWGLSHYSREEPCLERMEPYVFLQQPPFKGAKTGREEAVQKQAEKAFSALDANGDGSLSEAEVRKAFSGVRFRAPWTEVHDPAVLKEVAKEKIDWMAEDALLYHDDDRNGAISQQEFVDSVLKFDAVKERLKYVKKTKDRSKLLSKEREWIQQHLCADPSQCQQLDQLERDAGGKKKQKTEL